ncbi:hypothetical protein HMPREF0044_0450 [Gleimia coleocanis DSM 15436]|uniref:YchJ-like middle NTF2-like domain-containing protein n=2 Tax=Gleimia TaxID=2692113 RepID=C0VZ60_9ACTO|nr:hypothetical protein HMPREF0044_0450 [Gleimia coleocanis DSM 15436]
MRSRYCAFVLRDAAYLLRTWDPRTRPATLDFDDSLVWQGLEIVRTVRGQAEDTLGMVHFRAHYRFPTETGFSADVQEERSKFTRESTDSQWLYLD